jgi:F-type H+/Na+-transporting ATPase subunit alpha
VLLLFASANRYLDNVEISECQRYERELYPFIESNFGGILAAIREKKAFDDALKADVIKALDAFKEHFQATAAPATAAAATN